MSFKSYKLNEHIANYLISTMRKAFSGFSWGVTSFNESILKDVKISLPVDVNGNLDLQLMEETTRLIDKDYRFQIVSMLNSAGFEDCTLTAEEESALGNYMFKTFDNLCIGDYYQKVELNKRKFDKRKDTRQIPDAQHYIPLVNAKHGDNGIMYYGDPNVFDSVEMTIDIVQNGAIATGDVYPQPQRTGILWDAYLIQAISHKDSIETLIFFSTAIEKAIKKKYSYDNKAYWEHVKNDFINFPVNDDGDVDYVFMETYVRAIMKQTIAKLKSAMALDAEEGTSRILDFVAEQKHFATHLPVYPLRAACGYFDDCGKLQDEDAEGWIDASGLGRTLNDKMFVVHAEGDSMEPMIHNGELCAFDASGAGSREGKIVLVKAKDKSDPHASSFTIKKYHSEKVAAEEGGWAHSQIILSPFNPDYKPIVINAEETDADDFRIYGEYVGKV